MKKQIIKLDGCEKIKPDSQKYNDNIYFSEMSNFLKTASKKDIDLYYKFLKEGDFTKFQEIIRSVDEN